MDYIAPRNDPPTEAEPRPDYIDGDRGAGIKGSIPPAEFFQSVLDELLHLIETVQAATNDDTLDPDADDLTQVYRAIVALIESYGYLKADDLPAGAALIRSDLFIVVDGWLADPPVAPVNGDRYVVKADPTGAWAGHAQAIAHWDAAAEGGAAWAFVAPRTGLMAAMKEDGLAQILKFDGAAWAYLHASVTQPGLVTLYDPDDNPNGVLRGSDLDAATGLALIEERRDPAVTAEVLSAGAWHTRNLNTVVVNQIGASLGSRQITLLAGTYHVQADAGTYNGANHFLRMRNVTDSTTLGIGIASQAGSEDANIAPLWVQFTLASTKVIELQHFSYANRTTRAGMAFGVHNEPYLLDAEIRITKVG